MPPLCPGFGHQSTGRQSGNNFRSREEGYSAPDGQTILVDWLGAAAIVTGFDFHFGKGREGASRQLRSL
jgi:FAD synthase